MARSRSVCVIPEVGDAGCYIDIYIKEWFVHWLSVILEVGIGDAECYIEVGIGDAECNIDIGHGKVCSLTINFFGYLAAVPQTL